MEILKGQRQVQISEYISPQQRKEQEDAKVPSTKTKKEYIKNELFEKLRVLRKEIADKLNLPPYTIFHDSSLLEMADARPIDKAQFLAILGVGQEKMRKFGDAFINEIRAYIASQSDSGIKLAKGLTHVMSFEMYKDGMTVEEIAMQRNLSPTTIVGHLVKMKENGEEVDLRALVDNWTFDEVTKAIKELDMKPTDPVKPLFEHLGEQIDYGKLRLVLALQ